MAAESSAFPDSATSGVSGSNSTFNNTDTSGATTLPPASDAQDRLPKTQKDNDAGVGGEKYPESTGGPDFGDSKISDQGYAGGSAKGSSGGSSAQYNTVAGSGTASGTANVDSAPSYVSSVHTQDSKPKGKNITEGGFDTDAPNASFTTDIGSENDPGRAATAQFQRQSAGYAADSGLPKTQKGLDTDSPYNRLDTDQSA